MEVAPITETVPANAVLDHAAARPPALDHLADRFSNLLQSDPASLQLQQVGPADPTVITGFVGKQEQALQNVFSGVQSLAKQAPYLSIEEVTARHMELTWQMAMVSLQFNAGVYVAQGSKNGLQTLMKNQ
jgi:type III secretion inner rod protein HrpB2